MATIHDLLEEYGQSHQNATNKLIHWVCVPLIFFSITGLIMSIPFVTERSMLLNWAVLVLIAVLLYYLRMSFSLFVGFVGYAFLNISLAWKLYIYTDYDTTLFVYICLAIFVIAWIGQFIGHKIEGKKPSFFKDLQFLLIGPAWLMSFILRHLGIWR